MQAVEDKVISRVYGKGRGWSFFKNDFLDLGSADAIDQALSRLTKSQRIRRVMRGIYDYPRYSELLAKNLSPDVDQVAHALARKFNWRISPTGDTALNLLGVSTQVPGRYVYLCDGANREYELETVSIRFKKTTLKDIGFKLRESDLLVQAIKALGKERVNDALISQLRQSFSPAIHQKVLRDTKMTTSWVYGVIKRVCGDE